MQTTEEERRLTVKNPVYILIAGPSDDGGKRFAAAVERAFAAEDRAVLVHGYVWLVRSALTTTQAVVDAAGVRRGGPTGIAVKTSEISGRHDPAVLKRVEAWIADEQEAAGAGGGGGTIETGDPADPAPAPQGAP